MTPQQRTELELQMEALHTFGKIHGMKYAPYMVDKENAKRSGRSNDRPKKRNG